MILRIVLGWVLLLVTSDAAAQVLPRSADPGAIQQRDAQRREQQRLEEMLRERELKRVAPSVETTPTPAPVPSAPPVQIPLERIEIDPSAILSEAELRSLIAPYEGRTVTLQELQELVEAINQLYKQKGFITARAILPPQKVTSGVVKIALVEARIGRVDIEARHTRDFYVQQRLSFDRGELVDIRTAEEQLRRFNRIEDVQAQLMLRAGTEPGTTDFILKLAEPPQYNLDLFTDNQGQEDTGLLRGGVMASTPSLLGIRDSLFIQGYGTRDIEATAGGYEFPLTRWGTRFSVTFDYNHVSIDVPGAPTATPRPSRTRTPAVTRTPASNGLDLDGNSLHVGMRLTQPLVVKPTWLVNAFAEGHARQSIVSIGGGGELPPTHLRTAVAGFSFENTDPYGVTITSHSMMFAVDLHDDDFLKYQGSVARQQPFTPWLWASMRLNGQQAWSDLIPAIEQFQAGGVFSVRGYPEGYRIGDDGYATSVQLNAALPFLAGSGWARARDSLVAYGFVDHAGLFVEMTQGTRTRVDRTYLTSVGAGVSMSWGNWINYSVSLGVPLSERDDTRDALVHFAVHLTPPISDWVPGS